MNSAALVKELSWAAWLESIEALSLTGPLDGLLLTFQRAADQAAGPLAFAELLRLLSRAEEKWPLGAVGERLRWRCLANVPGGAVQLEERVQTRGNGELLPFMQVYWAFALAALERFDEAVRVARRVLAENGADLTVQELRLAHRTLARSLLLTGEGVGWESSAKAALDGQEGVGRGLTLLDLGAALSHRGLEAQAMQFFSEALPLFQRTPFYQAWTLHNMALVCLRSGRLAEADSYFERASRLKTPFERRAMSGQAAVRRVLGEWQRAEALYHRAIGLAWQAGDEDDLRQALRGLGHTYRLSGQVMQALEVLQQASQAVRADRESGYSWVNVDIAAAYVCLPPCDAGRVEQLLSMTGVLGHEDAGRANLVRAELLRREGRGSEASSMLLGLPREALWLREELTVFTALFDLVPEHLRPESLRRAEQLEVKVTALGVPEVRVNGRLGRLTTLALVVLVALMEAGGQLTSEELIWVLRDDSPRRDRLQQQRVSTAVRQLRRGLGWEGSVTHVDRAYRLDPAVSWVLDVTLARQKGEVIEAFCTGIHLPWVTDREQELRQQDSGHLS